jgi:hypothetical protein
MDQVPKEPRSVSQHRRFFGLVRALYQHWPERIEFQPDTEEHLRAYLLVKAGYRSVKTFYPEVKGMSADFAKMLPVVTALMLHRYCWAWADGEAVKVCAPESIAFNKLPHKKACEVLNNVEEFLRTLGIEPDEVLKQNEAAA